MISSSLIVPACHRRTLCSFSRLKALPKEPPGAAHLGPGRRHRVHSARAGEGGWIAAEAEAEAAEERGRRGGRARSKSHAQTNRNQRTAYPLLPGRNVRVRRWRTTTCTRAPRPRNSNAKQRVGASGNTFIRSHGIPGWRAPAAGPSLTVARSTLSTESFFYPRRTQFGRPF